MISEDRFQKFDWEDLYPDACEPIPLDMPRPRGKSVLTHCFVDANHSVDKTARRSMTGIITFCNRALIIWHSKRKNGVETSTFGSEVTSMKNYVELIAALRYKLRMFGFSIDGLLTFSVTMRQYRRMHPRPNLISGRNTIVHRIT